MRRVDYFRTIRQTRWRYFSSFLLFFLILIPGICTVDYSVNSLVRNVNEVKIVTLNNIDNSYYEINFANRKLYINTMYIKRDYQRLKNKITGFINKSD